MSKSTTNTSYLDKINNLINYGAGHVILGSFVTKFITFFGSIFIVRFLTKSEYGVLSYYENILGYFCVFCGMGMAAGIQRYLILANTLEEKKGCYRLAFKEGNLWNFVLCLICILFCLFYPHPDAFRGFPFVYICLSLCIPLIYLCNMTLSSYRSLFDYQRYAYLAVGTAFLLVAARVVGAAIGGLNYSVAGRLIAEIACVVLCVLTIYSSHFKRVKTKLPSKRFSKNFTNYSLQMMLTDGLWAIFMLNDIFLLGQITGDNVLVADYKIAYVIPANISIIAASIGIFTAPYFTQKDKEGNSQWVSEKLKETLLVNMAAIAAIAILCFFLGKQIITLLFSAQYLSAIPIMNVLLIASFFNNGIRFVIANFMSAIGEQKKNLIVAGIGIVIQVALDFIFIPRMGAIGVGVSSLIVYFLMSIMLLYVVRNRLIVKKVD